MRRNKIIYGNICVKALKTIDAYVSKLKMRWSLMCQIKNY